MALNLHKHICTLLHRKSGSRILFNSVKTSKAHCLISCKRSELNHYLNTKYDDLDLIPLASKGWIHSKSHGDYFIINPVPEEFVKPNQSFTDLNIPQELLNVLKKEGIRKATEFQALTIEKIRTGKHLMIAAETGCGKTLCYLLPIIQNLIGKKTDELNSPRAIIVLPNRELAYQIGEMAQLLGDPVNVKVTTLVGGFTKRLMLNPEFDEIDLLVATPGVLSKLSTVGIYRLKNVIHTVFDEADTLLDDSFMDRMSILIKRLSQSQILMVSATLPRNLPDILQPLEDEHSLEKVVSPKLHKTSLCVKQKFLRMSRTDKPSHLLNIAKGNKDPMVVFTGKTATSQWLAMFLRENGLTCSNVNGDMNHALRIEQWNAFVKGNTQVLSSTDIASRGLDTTQIKHVVNYDFPLYSADYLHRIGRVGRLGSPDYCKATNFISGPREVSLVQQIELAVRRNEALTNVDGNISRIIQRKIERQQQEFNEFNEMR